MTNSLLTRLMNTLSIQVLFFFFFCILSSPREANIHLHRVRRLYREYKRGIKEKKNKRRIKARTNAEV